MKTTVVKLTKLDKQLLGLITDKFVTHVVKMSHDIVDCKEELEKAIEQTVESVQPWSSEITGDTLPRTFIVYEPNRKCKKLYAEEITFDLTVNINRGDVNRLTSKLFKERKRQ